MRELLTATKGKLLKGKEELECQGISTDSRKLKKGELFVALKGERFDGHDFIPQAIKKGAAGVVVKRGFPILEINTPPKDFFIIQVKDCLKALGDLAHFLRKKSDVKVIAITGSNGKTTTKEMTALVLKEHFEHVLKSEGNMNNLIGLPLSLLHLTPETKVAVLEMGMNHPGEIRRLAEIACPDIGLITNIGPAHLEGLGSLPNIQKAKGELFKMLKGDNFALVNYDDPLIKEIAQDCKAKRITFGLHKGAEVSGKDIRFFKDGSVNFKLITSTDEVVIKLKAYGIHHVYNALAAAATGIVLGVKLSEISRGLSRFSPLKGRSQIIELNNGIMLIDETYNANPVSMEIALKTLNALKGKGRGVAVLGDMLELGIASKFYHKKIGRVAAKTGTDYLVLLGEFAPLVAQGASASGFTAERIFIGKDCKEIAFYLKCLLNKGDWVLIKGSRGMQMERVIEYLRKGS